MATFEINWSKEAPLDLVNVLDYYIKRNKSNIYSIKLNAKIQDDVKLLVRNSSLETRTDYESVRAMVSDDYHIIYEIIDQMILIIMIWDCRRNPGDKIIDRRIKNRPTP